MNEVNYSETSATEEFENYIKKMPLRRALYKFYSNCLSGVAMMLFDLLVLVLKAPCLFMVPGEFSRQWERLDSDYYFRKTFIKMAFNELCIKVVYICTAKVAWRN